VPAEPPGPRRFFDAASGGHIEAARRAPPHSQRIIHKDNAMLAHHFGVSYQAAVHGLKSLRYISGAARDDLLATDRSGVLNRMEIAWNQHAGGVGRFL